MTRARALLHPFATGLRLVRGAGGGYSITSKRPHPEEIVRKTLSPLAPRERKMKVEETDWPSVWPTAHSFKPSAVPLPIRMGKPINMGVPAWKYANTELTKLPNFLHLTPPAIRRHCEAIHKFTTPWPSELGDERLVNNHFPVEVTTSDYCFSGPSIRHPEARVCTLRVSVDALKLPDERAEKKFMRLANGGVEGTKERYNPSTRILTLVVDCCPTRKQNTDYALYLLTVLYHEALNHEEWEEEEEKVETYFDWEHNDATRCTFEALFAVTGQSFESPAAREVRESLVNLMKVGESEETLERYKQAVTNLVIPSQTDNKLI